VECLAGRQAKVEVAEGGAEAEAEAEETGAEEGLSRQGQRGRRTALTQLAGNEEGGEVGDEVRMTR
jgi:hypothetical protein